MSKETHAHGAVHPAIPAGGGPGPANYRGVFLKIGNQTVGAPGPAGQPPAPPIYEIASIKNVIVKAAGGNNGHVHFTITFDSEDALFKDSMMTWEDVAQQCHTEGNDRSEERRVGKEC